MDSRTGLLAAVDRWCRRSGLKRSTVATRAVNDGKFFDRIEGGGRFTTQTYDRVMAWLKANPPKAPRKARGWVKGRRRGATA